MIPMHQTGHGGGTPFPIRGIARKKLLIENFQGVLGLPYLALRHSRTFTKICRKPLDITARTIQQPFSRGKINKSLRAFDIKRRTIRPYPALLHAGPKGTPKSLRGSRFDWNYLSHKTNTTSNTYSYFHPIVIGRINISHDFYVRQHIEILTILP